MKLTLCTVFLVVIVIGANPAFSFDYSRQLFGTPQTLSILVQSINYETGVVVINGGDSAQPTIPFTFDWGDGHSKTDSFLSSTRTRIPDITTWYP